MHNLISLANAVHLVDDRGRSVRSVYESVRDNVLNNSWIRAG